MLEINHVTSRKYSNGGLSLAQGGYQPQGYQLGAQWNNRDNSSIIYYKFSKNGHL